ncbi:MULTISPECIES: hypothetical protein [Streptacidiphilus]|uniref:Uncharacterized protein n=1 Tax=Streptacidiphilus cavernicola TaxID=3342716 RepID=A0ABV6UTR0_9ACTN|nr:hypothetical protein [Streptacidiphilus jeojiense]
MVATVSFVTVVLFFMVATSAFSVYAARLHWIGSSRAPRVAAFRYSSDPSAVRGHERGIVPLAGWTTCMTLGLLLTALTHLGRVAMGFIFGSFLLLAMYFTVVWFNWPKSIVPPGRRSETGSVIERVRWRRDIQIGLKEAAERDAPSIGKVIHGHGGEVT